MLENVLVGHKMGLTNLVSGLQYGLRTVTQEWADGISWFFACRYRFINIKSWSKMYWMSMIKNRCGQSGHRTLSLKLTLSQIWTDRINWFFACWYKFREAKSWFNDSLVGLVKNGSELLVYDNLNLYLKNWLINLAGFF